MKKTLLFLIFSFFPSVLSFGAEETIANSNSIVIWKDMTIPARGEYENIVVMSGQVDFFGKTDKLVVIGGSIKIHEGAEVKNQMVVLGGSVEQLKGALVPETPPTKTPSSFWGRWNSWSNTWIQKWKDRFENPDADEESPKTEHWTKVFLFPFMLAIPLSIMIVLFGLAMIFFSIAPKLSDSANDILLKDPFVSLAWGAMAYLFFTPLVAVLTLSIVGIPLVPLVVFFAILFILAGFFSASRTLGHLLLSRTGIHVRAFDTLLGLLLLYGILFMPFIGKLLVFFILIAGTGAVIRSFMDARRITRFGFGSGRTFDI